jgi:hypothetical protein
MSAVAGRKRYNLHTKAEKPCESGGIGRRTRFRFWRRKVWGFESPLSHQGFARRFQIALHTGCRASPTADAARTLPPNNQEMQCK